MMYFYNYYESVYSSVHDLRPGDISRFRLIIAALAAVSKTRVTLS